MFKRFTDKFKEYTLSNDKFINEIIIDVDDYDLKPYLLNDIIKLLEKVILNKLSADLLFQKNYWSWGFVTIYYSNFYMAQLLNKIAGKFFLYKQQNFNKYVQFNKDIDLYNIPQSNNGETSHLREFKQLKNNYAYIKTWNDVKLQPILDKIGLKKKDILFKYTIDNDIKESEIRNEINYKLNNYQEIAVSQKENILNLKIYKLIIEKNNCNCRKFKNFELVKINHFRMKFLSILIQEIIIINPAFKLKIERLKNKINNKYDIEFHSVNENIKMEIERIFG